MAERHVIVTGTGRAGTTFLIQLFTHLGLDTGFDSAALTLSPLARAGLEIAPRALAAPGAPYIVKSPYFCDALEGLLKSFVQIEHAIVPVRQFEAAAASRVHVQDASLSPDGRPAVGGLWDADSAEEQAAVLRFKFTTLVEVLVRHDVPTTFLYYPRHLRDPDYLYGKLGFLLGHIDPDSFRAVFHAIVRPDWIHQFDERDC